MNRKYDIAYSLILILFLVVAVFIGNSIFKGILLLIFSTVLIFNTILKLKHKSEGRITGMILYGILLFLNSILALGSIYIIVSSVIDAV